MDESPGIQNTYNTQLKVIEQARESNDEYKLEVIDDPESPRITEIAALDMELFGEHKSLTATEFRAIVENLSLIHI